MHLLKEVNYLCRQFLYHFGHQPSMVNIIASSYPHIFKDFWNGTSKDISLIPLLQGMLKERAYITAFYFP